MPQAMGLLLPKPRNRHQEIGADLEPAREESPGQGCLEESCRLPVPQEGTRHK